ncbi:MAG: prepilin-type N-terminal cleavage/methylation domain-containing protein [Planctomycetota bacterium]|jgi:prepilin-type N-terminal cleavage/methylation domain-containing protein
MRLNRIRAFTLVEILVVISIIALLVAILVPCLGAARERAKRAICMANLHSIGLSIFDYAHNNDDKLIPGDFAVPWDVWGWRSEEPGSEDKTYREVNLGHLVTSGALPKPGNNDHVFFCPSSRTPDGRGPSEDFVQAWGSSDTEASITYMFNTALDGFDNYIQEGRQAVLSHRDKINFLLGDGSVQVFNVKPLVFDPLVGPELLPEVSARTGVCFPPIMLHRWLERGDIDLPEAKKYLEDPPAWAAFNSSLSVLKPVLMANIGKRSLVCDVVGVWGGVLSSPPPAGGG